MRAVALSLINVGVCVRANRSTQRESYSDCQAPAAADKETALDDPVEKMSEAEVCGRGLRKKLCGSDKDAINKRLTHWRRQVLLLETDLAKRISCRIQRSPRRV
jgi:hypothetical protein